MWSIARGNTKSTIFYFKVIVPFALTKGKKKKSFLKWLYGRGIKKDIICDYEKWIREGKGKYSYCWATFIEYVHNNDLMKEI